MNRTHNPPHPGLTLRDDVLPALRLGVTQAAEQLTVATKAQGPRYKPRPRWVYSLALVGCLIASRTPV
jgi:hypothetical protein